MCSAPVTLGGGTAIEKFSSGRPVRLGMEEPGLQPAREDPRLGFGGLPAGAFVQVAHRALSLDCAGLDSPALRCMFNDCVYQRLR